MRWHYSPTLFHVQAFQLTWYPWEQTRTYEDTITSSMTLCFPSKYTCKWHISVLGYTPLHFLLHFQCLHLMDGVPGAVANWTWIWVLSSCYSKNPWLDGLSVESDSGQKGIQMLAGNFRRIDTQENCKWQLGSIVSARYKAYLSPVIEKHQFSQLSSPQSGDHELILRWRKKHDGHDVQRFGASSVQKRWKHQVG